MVIPGEDCQRAEDEDGGEIGDLLERVVTVVSVELRRQVECRIDALMYLRDPVMVGGFIRPLCERLGAVPSVRHGL